ncbi:D-alanyl-D-alanine carboxypeptidase (penicillin-binding protein 5/6) [Paenibacillus sp. 1_12]|uniref:D-alanyl-D-alanine carboxypeptidase family protein n=1 Tax=Paenibacillus sp. 1_12 TaxID=1566278 RepID=UPI0008E4C7D4|nr:D-alanyl-D-alanine carboxypeptidase family protein [Paenibacillus sp. 1_12]SFM35589.1 D-alanyl-D-alanine carboxypeptidase (penicillin-binding protein 5/6) [Paenibacillus sp. 1_12]
MKYNNEVSITLKCTKSISRKCLISLILLLCLFFVPVSTFAETTILMAQSTESIAAKTISESVKIPSISSLNLKLKSAVLLEPITGQVLLSKNADKAYAPASMTKLMTGYIIEDKVKNREISWNDVVTVKENASKTIGSRVFLAKGETHTVKELFFAMLIHSANDAAVALAEYVSGSEKQFVTLMNQEAQRMGMVNSYFINSSGLDRADMPITFRSEEKGENMMSAMDVANLVKYIIQDHPDFLETTTIQSYKFRASDREALVNTNWMLESNKNVTQFKQFAYEGLDGLKTGFTDSAGYCFASTAERNGMRLISVVMGTESTVERFTETKKVLDFGFNYFEVRQVVASNSTAKGVDKVPVKKGTKTEVPVVTEQAINFIVPKGTDASQLSFKTSIMVDELTAPFHEGTKTGTITYTYQIEGMANTQEKTVNLVSSQEMEKAGWFRLMLRSLWEGFHNIF